jgi:predicted nucleic acid-binding protein
MSLPEAFWDSSVLIPLAVQQPQSAAARLLYAKYTVVAWWGTEVEIRSGLTRLKRMGQITASEFDQAKQIAEKIIRGWESVTTRPTLTQNACNALELFPLTAADAMQLAAALEACEHAPQEYVFITADQRLAEAARQTGFAVELL